MWGQPPPAVRRAKPDCRMSSTNPVILSEVAVRKADGNAVEGSLPSDCVIVPIQGPSETLLETMVYPLNLQTQPRQ